MTLFDEDYTPSRAARRLGLTQEQYEEAQDAAKEES